MDLLKLAFGGFAKVTQNVFAKLVSGGFAKVTKNGLA